MTEEQMGRQKQYQEDLLGLGELQEENKQLRDEIEKLRPMARLAIIISMMEGESLRLHNQVVKDDREFDKVRIDYCSLKLRVDVLEVLLAEADAKKS
jgi:hypothetical protein